MLNMLLKYTLTALLLACRVAAVPEGKMILGYRTALKVEADLINAAGTPVFDGADYGGGRQLGAGVYTSPYPGAWKVIRGKWVCVIYIDAQRFKDIHKAWIPYYRPSTENVMWYEDKEINEYITTLGGGGGQPDKTLRMAWVQDFKGMLQMLIPPGIVASHRDLGLTAVCKPKIDDLPDKAPINYDDWKDNVWGDKGPELGWDGKPI